MIETENLYLDSILKAERVFWAGRWPPLGRMKASTDIFDVTKDHRLHPTMHRAFEVVLLVESDLGATKQWPIILDEAMRLLDNNGTLVLRYRQSGLLAEFALKNHIYTWANGAVEPFFESKTQDGYTIFAAKFSTTKKIVATTTSIAFCLVTDGRRNKEVSDFITSVRTLDGLQDVEYEILVCGPSSITATVPSWGGDCRIVEEPKEFSDSGWISRKKNLCVRSARHENILIAHDRYVLAKDFLSELQEFGGDFDILVCRQALPGGERFPDWVTLGSDWSLTAPAMLPPGEYCRYAYVNGGILLGKTDTLRRIGWNELLMWGQAEDVELSRRLKSNGIVARYARNIVAVSTTFRKGFLEDFETLPASPRSYLTGQHPNETGMKIVPRYSIGQRVLLTDSFENLAVDFGVRVGEHWYTANGGIRLSSGYNGEICLRLYSFIQEGIELIVGMESSDQLELSVNGASVDVWIDREGNLRAHINPSLLRNTILRMVFSSPVANPHTVIKSIELNYSEQNVESAPHSLQSFCTGNAATDLLLEGWCATEAWGTWSSGNIHRLIIPNVKRIDLHSVKVVRLAFEMQTLKGTVQKIGVSMNEIPFALLSLHYDETKQVLVEVPSELLQKDRTNYLTFHSQSTISPKQLGINQDNRQLSIGILNMRILES